MTTEMPYSLAEYGRAFQVMLNGEAVLDTNKLNKSEMQSIVDGLNDAYQRGFSNGASAAYE